MTGLGKPLRLRGLSKRYGNFEALKPTDLDVGAGEFLTLLGPSGSGKTTLLNLIAGYGDPTTGSIGIGDRDVTRLAARHRNIGMVFQNYALFPHMSVGENVAYGLAVRRLPKAEIDRRVAEILGLMQLDGFASRAVQQLSGGQQQRVALARALVIEPDVLLMDEPLGALDQQLRRSVQLELRRLHLRHGRTTIYVTHDQEEALILSDRIAVMDKGRIQQLGSVDDLYDQPVNAFVAGFIGESNLLPAYVEEVGDGHAVAAIDAFRSTLRFAAAPSVEARSHASLLIRPEHLVFAAEGFPAEIVETVYLGELTQHSLRLESGATLVARQITDRTVGPGARVHVSWKLDTARIVPKTPHS